MAKDISSGSIEMLDRCHKTDASNHRHPLAIKLLSALATLLSEHQGANGVALVTEPHQETPGSHQPVQTALVEGSAASLAA